MNLNRQEPYEVLRDCLHRNRTVGPGTEWNISGMGKHDKGTYRIPDKEYEKFLKLVHDTIFGKPPVTCGLLERHLPTGGPILIDLDFRYTAGSHIDRKFTDEMISNFIVEYVSALYRYFVLSNLDKKHLRFFVMLKPSAEADVKQGAAVHKDGVHIICPDLTLDPKIQYTLRGYILQKNIIRSVFGESNFINAEEDVFDISVINRNNWFLYGATKPDKAWYKVTSIYHIPTDLAIGSLSNEATLAALEESLLEGTASEYTDLEFTKLFSIRLGHENNTTMKVIEDRHIEWDHLYEKWSGGKNLVSMNSPAALQVSQETQLESNIEKTTSDINKETNTNGYVYCLTNKLMPGICKVGFTLRSPYLRIKELGGTNIPVDYDVEWAYPSNDAHKLELATHKKLAGARVNVNREFFKETPSNIFKIMFELSTDY